MGYTDWDAIEAQRLAEDQAGVRRWSDPWETPDRSAGGMMPTGSSDYGPTQHIGELLAAYRAYEAEMQNRLDESSQNMLATGRYQMDPEVQDWMTEKAMGLVMGSVGPMKFSPKEAAMRATRQAQTQARSENMKWNEPGQGGVTLQDAIADLLGSQESRVANEARGAAAGPRRGSRPAPSQDPPWMEREYEFGAGQPSENPNIDRLSEATRQKNIRQNNPYIDEESRMMREINALRPAAQTTRAETPQSSINKMFNESPAIRDMRLRNFMLKEGGNEYQHPLPYAMSDVEATARSPIGYNPDAWYSPGNILSAIGYGIKGGAQAIAEESPTVQRLWSAMPDIPQMPGRVKAFLSEHPVGIGAGAAAGAGYAFGPDMGQYTEGIAIPNTEASRENARKFETGLAKHAGTAPPVLNKTAMQRAQQPFWGVTPEDIQAALEYFQNMTRDPFSRMASR